MPASVSCSQAAALMINGAVENSSLGLFFSPELRTRFRSSKCPRVMLSHLSGCGALHPHLDRCLELQMGQVGIGPGEDGASWGLVQVASPQAQAHLLWGKGPWECGVVIFQVPKLLSSCSMECKVLYGIASMM